MPKPVIFTISAVWDDEASAWSGHCDDIPAAADAPTLDELLAKISAMALDLLPENYPDVDPASLYLQITVLRPRRAAKIPGQWHGVILRACVSFSASHGWFEPSSNENEASRSSERVRRFWYMVRANLLDIMSHQRF